jgi:hypothetical protein
MLSTILFTTTDMSSLHKMGMVVFTTIPIYNVILFTLFALWFNRCRFNYSTVKPQTIV